MKQIFSKIKPIWLPMPWLMLAIAVHAGDMPVPLSASQATDALRKAVSQNAWRPQAVSLAPAKWIWLPTERTLPNSFVLFRKEVELADAPTRADGWISADSRYKLTVNGQRVQWGPAPCDPRNLDADPVDLKPYLQPGKNVIGIEVLFFGHGDGTWPAGRPGMIFNLAIETQSKKFSVVTDSSWQSLLDRAHRPGQYKRWFLRSLQEEFDARLYPYGWDTADFRTDSRWVPAREVNCPPDKPISCRGDSHWSNDSADRTAPEVSALRMRQIPATQETVIAAKGLAHSGRVHWLRDPADWFDVRMENSFRVDENPIGVAKGDGVWELPETPKADQGVEATFEMSEQIAGFPRFTIDAPAGTIVELMVQESHNPQKSRWLDSYFFCWSRFICREGVNVFEGFDYESLRWMQLHMGDIATAQQAQERGNTLLKAATGKFWSVEQRLFIDNLPWLATDHAPQLSDRTLAMSILFDQCPGNDRTAALTALANPPAKLGLSYPCNAGWRYWALAKAGRADVVLTEFRKKWATMSSVLLNNTLQEDWVSGTDSTSQWSHCPLAPIYVLYQDIVGLRPLAPGFTRMQFRPQFGDLPDLQVVAQTPMGPVEVSAKRNGTGHDVVIKIPDGYVAELVLPLDVTASFPLLDTDEKLGVGRYRLPSGGGRFSVPLRMTEGK